MKYKNSKNNRPFPVFLFDFVCLAPPPKSSACLQKVYRCLTTHETGDG